MERFVVNIENEIIEILKNIAHNNGVSISWLLRALLLALAKKYKNGLGEHHNIVRPRKFKNHFSQFTMCFYGDKLKWILLARSWKAELGPLLRFGIELFLQAKLTLDFENEKTVKKIKSYKKVKNIIKNSLYGYIYHQQINVDLYETKDFWPKSEKNNILISKRGLSNRKKPRKYGKIN